MSDAFGIILLSVAMGFVAPWWTHFMRPPPAISHAGLRLARTLDAMFFSVPFFGFFGLIAGPSSPLERIGLHFPLSLMVGGPILFLLPFAIYRLAALLPGVKALRLRFFDADPSGGEMARMMAGLPSEAVK